MLTARSTSWLLLTRSQQDRQRACSTMYPPSLGTGSPSGIIPNPGGGMLLIGSSQFKFLWARENWAFAQFCRLKGAHRSTRKVLHVSGKDTTWLALSQYFIFVGNTYEFRLSVPCLVEETNSFLLKNLFPYDIKQHYFTLQTHILLPLQDLILLETPPWNSPGPQSEDEAKSENIPPSNLKWKEEKRNRAWIQCGMLP